jgi:hypothetical protein
MQCAYNVIERLGQTLRPSEVDRVLRSAYVRFNRLRHVCNCSGLLSCNIIEWLNNAQSNDQEAISYDLYELSLMYSEFDFQLLQFLRSLHQVANHTKISDPDTLTRIKSVIDDLEALFPKTDVEPQSALKMSL